MATLTLNAEIKETLSSLDGERIEQLLAWHLAENDSADVTSFLSHLYREGLITHVEYARAQLLASVEVTAPTVFRPRRRRPAASDDSPRTEMQPVPRRANTGPDAFRATLKLDQPLHSAAPSDDFPQTLKLDEPLHTRAPSDDFPPTVRLKHPPHTRVRRGEPPPTVKQDRPGHAVAEADDGPPTVKRDRPRHTDDDTDDDDYPRTLVLGERRGVRGATPSARGRHTADAPTEAAPDGAPTVPRAAPRAAPADTPAPATGYTLLDAIDEGGMGEILIARDNDLGRTVAFKKIHAHVAEHAGMVERFFMEAQVTAQLQHPYIVPVYQLVQNDGELGYAMKLVAGKTFGQLFGEARKQLEHGGPPDDEHATATLLDHFLKVCDAIHYANRKGVLHRDLKPANIMVGAYNEVYVMDWGIAKLLDRSTPGFEDVTEPLRDLRPRSDDDRTQIGDAIGTPAYMSPEQARGDLEHLDHRSDQYALGLILFELLTLNRARVGRDADELARNARDGVLAAVEPFHPSLAVAKPLAAILAKATRSRPEQRYATTREFAEDIRHYLHNEPVAAMPDTLVQKLGRWMVRHRVATMNIAAYAVLGFLALAGLSVYRHQQATIEAEQREVHIGHMLSTVSARAGAIDTRLLRAQGILEGLAASAAGLYVHGRAETGALYTDADFRDAARAPVDLEPSPAYGTGISVDWPVYALAPDVAMTDVEPVLRKVDALRHGFRHLMLRSRDEPRVVDETSAAARRLFTDATLPVHLLQLGFEPGFLMAYPGHAGYPPGYDPRSRPWYVQAMQAGRTLWLAPFGDASGGGGVLSVATPIAVESGETVGAAVVEMTLAKVRRDFLDTSAVPGIERLLLLDEAGDILAVSGQSGAQEAGATVDAVLPDVYRGAVLSDIGKQRSGFLNYEDGAREMLLSWHRLGATGWYLLAEADAATVLALY